MEVLRVEDCLGGLTLLKLKALIPNRQPYALMLLQPDGPFEGSRERVGHFDRERGMRICRGFLDQAVAEHADVVVTPEYCLPWDLVSSIAAADSKLRPDEGAIWILGCESIAPAVLAAAVAQLRANGCFVHHEHIDPAQAALKHYIDPLLYVFWSSRADGTRVLTFVVQFKTEPCRDGMDVEVGSLYVGNIVYTFNRGVDTIGLMSIICSDAFEFTDQLVKDNHSNMLLVHIQLNQKPAHGDYAKYRRELLSIGSDKNVELVCLNWAGNMIEADRHGKTKNWKNNAGSCIYVPPAKFGATEAHIDNAHRQGVFYSLLDRWHALFLDQSPHAVKLQKYKVMVHGEPVALTPKTCVAVHNRWSWAPAGENFAPNMAVNDGFSTVLGAYSSLPGQLLALAAQSPLAVERALELLVGSAKKSDRWHEIKELESMRCGQHEAVRRVTVHQDFDPDSVGVPYRKQRLQRAQDAATLPGHGVPWPHTLSDLEHGFSFQWSAAEPQHNVVSTTTTLGAGLIYLADQHDDRDVRAAFKVLVEGARLHAVKGANETGSDAMTAVTRCADRLCAVYRRDHAFQAWGVDRLSRIDRDPGQSEFDIGGEAT